MCLMLIYRHGEDSLIQVCILLSDMARTGFIPCFKNLNEAKTSPRFLFFSSGWLGNLDPNLSKPLINIHEYIEQLHRHFKLI
jgi:hypothetical protein